MDLPEWVKARNQVANEEGEEEEETWLVGARLLNKGVSKKADKVRVAMWDFFWFICRVTL